MDCRSLSGKESAATSSNPRGVSAATDSCHRQRIRKRDAAAAQQCEGGPGESDIKFYSASMATSYINSLISEAGIKRSLCDADIAFLLQLAGFTQYNRPEDPVFITPDQGTPVMKRQLLPKYQWGFFTGWFKSKVMPALKAVQHLWDRRSPTDAICPLSTTRAMCESALGQAVPGAFCVRARLKVGSPVTWVISYFAGNDPAGSAEAKTVLHILLKQKHLDIHGLDVWVRDLKHLMYCMDISTGALMHKEQLFLQGYKRMEQPQEESSSVNANAPPQTDMPTHTAEEFDLPEPSLSLDETQAFMAPGCMESSRSRAGCWITQWITPPKAMLQSIIVANSSSRFNVLKLEAQKARPPEHYTTMRAENGNCPD